MAENVIEFTIKAKDDFSRQFSELESALTVAAKAFAITAAAAAAISFAKLIQESIEVADQFGKMAQRTGIAVDTFSQLAGVFALSDVSAQELGHSMELLNKSISEATSGNSAAQASFQSIGITLKDLKSLSPDQILLRLADTFSKTADGANKTAAALELFGRSGTRMIPGLNQGRDGVIEMIKKVDELGMTVDAEFAKQAEQFNDSMKLMRMASQGLANQIAASLLPVLNQTIESIGDISKTSESAIPWAKIFSYAVGVIAIAFTSLVGVVKEAFLVISGFLQSWGNTFGGIAAAAAQALSGDFKGAAATVKEAWTDSGKIMEQAMTDAGKTMDKSDESIKKIWDSIDTASTKTTELGKSITTVNKNPLNFVSKQTASQLEELHKKQVAFMQDLSAREARARDDKLANLKIEYDAEITKMNQLKLEGEQRVNAMATLDKWYAEQRYNVETQLLSKLGDSNASYLDRKLELLNREAQHMLEVGIAAQEVEKFLYDQRLLMQFNFVEAQKKQLEEEATAQIYFAETVGATWIATWDLISARALNTSQQVSQIITTTFNQVTEGVGKAVANAIVSGKNLGESLRALMQDVLTSIIEMLVKMGVQRLIFMALNISSSAAEASSNLARGFAETYVNSFSSAAAIPYVGWMIAPGAASANLAMAMAGAAGAIGAGHGMGAAVGAAHGGMTNVPSESTFLLDEGERVLSPKQNQDLTSFLDSQDDGGMSIGQLNIYITGSDFEKMSPSDLERLVADKFYGAMNRLDKKGLRPNFIQRQRQR